MKNFKIIYGIGGVYSITNKINGKRSIGSTIQKFEDRRISHLCLLRNNRHFSGHLQAAWNKYGESNFKFEIIVENRWKTEKELRKIETLFIKLYNTTNPKFGYNVIEDATAAPMFKRHHTEKSRHKISEANKGKIISEETKEKLRKSHQGTKASEEVKRKMSESKLGEKNSNFGKPRSEETKEKIRENKPDQSGENHPLFGKHHTEETKNKISEAHMGKKVSEETKKKMSEAHKGKSINKGKPSSFRGKHHTEETKNKLRENHLRKKLSTETKEKMSRSLTGRKHSEETKSKISASGKGKNKGKTPWNKGKKQIKES